MPRLRAMVWLMVVFAWMLVAAGPPAPGNDGALERAIRARFERSKIRVEGFTVRVERGAAVIEGRTKVIQRKGTATRLAKLAGARTVDNRIQVDETARERASENLAKGRRRAQVKREEPRTEPRSERKQPGPATLTASPVKGEAKPTMPAPAAPRRAVVVAGK